MSARKSRKAANVACRKQLGGKNGRNHPGVLAQHGECCAWISKGCLSAKKAFPKNNVPDDFCGAVALGKDRKRGDH